MNYEESLKRDYHPPDESESVLLGIPAYNEELSIGSVLLKSKKVDVVDDILVVDDGSDDDTSNIAKDAGVKVLRHRQNVGKGAAIKTIFRYAREGDYDYLVLIDGDGQHNPYEIPHVLSKVVNPGADISIGARWGDWTEMPLYRKVGKNVLDFLTPSQNGEDTQSGFRAFNREAIEELELTQNDFTIESEMLVVAEEKGLEVESKRITCRYNDVDNASTQGPVRHGLEVMNKLIRITVERRPLVYLGIPGLIFFLFGFISGFYVIHMAADEQILSIGGGLLTIAFIIMGSIFVTSGFILNEIRQLMRKNAEHEMKHVEIVQE